MREDTEQQSIVQAEDIQPSHTNTDKSQPQSRKGTWWRIVLRLLIVVMLVIALNIGMDSLLPSTAFWFHLPSSSSPVVAGQEMFRFHYTLPWGTLSLDGKALNYIPRSELDYPIAVAPGKHTLTLDSAPFPRFQCTFVVPTPAQREKDETCQTQQQQSSADSSPVTTLAFSTHPSLALLSVQSRQALEQATQQYLDTLQSEEQMQRGELYRTTYDAPLQPASQPMLAKLRFVLDTDTSHPPQCVGSTLGPHCTEVESGDDCRLFCTVPIAYDGIAEGKTSWEVGVITRPTWTYGATSKELHGDQQYTLLLVRWSQGHWVVNRYDPQASSLSDPNCSIVVNDVVTAIQSATANPQGPQASDWSFTSSAYRAQGCVVTITLQEHDVQSGKTVQRKAYLLWRFNVLLAANPDAQRLLPKLPVAPLSDQSIVQAILAHPDSIS
jgi:hypothetical protein